MFLTALCGSTGFQSTLPVWGATANLSRAKPEALISIHAPRVGSDEVEDWTCASCYYFNPRSPCGERPNTSYQRAVKDIFQSTLPVWGATPAREPERSTGTYFNPRSPCGERPGSFSRFYKRFRFQSTLPVWGATKNDMVMGALGVYFNPRSPCGERLFPKIGFLRTSHFNPRSPCGERRKALQR